MAILVFNRKEIKYILSDSMYHKIRGILEDRMEVDQHSKNGDFYTICNIYYDTEDHDLIRQSIDKPVYKEKLRLRSYGIPSMRDKVYLEIKKKYNGIVNKRRVSLSLEEVYHYFAENEKPVPKNYLNKQVFNEIDYLRSRYILQPTLFLAYDRNAYFDKENRGFRITFDTNIRTRRTETGLEQGDYGKKLLPEGIWIMEAKAEQSFPLWFSRLLAEYKLYPTSFSKYGTEYKKTILQQPLQINNPIITYHKEEQHHVSINV